MKDTIDFLYMQKKLSNEWVHLIPSEEERLAHEKFDDTLTKEQRILLREYERQHLLRIDKLNREVFESGFLSAKTLPVFYKQNSNASLYPTKNNHFNLKTHLLDRKKPYGKTAGLFLFFKNYFAQLALRIARLSIISTGILSPKFSA